MYIYSNEHGLRTHPDIIYAWEDLKWDWKENYESGFSTNTLQYQHTSCRLDLLISDKNFLFKNKKLCNSG